MLANAPASGTAAVAATATALRRRRLVRSFVWGRVTEERTFIHSWAFCHGEFFFSFEVFYFYIHYYFALYQLNDSFFHTYLTETRAINTSFRIFINTSGAIFKEESGHMVYLELMQQVTISCFVLFLIKIHISHHIKTLHCLSIWKTVDSFSNPIISQFLTIIVSINWLFFWLIKCRKIMKNVDQCFPKSKVTPSNVLFCPQYRNII